MKKKFKILLPVLLIVIIFVILIVLGIIPNPFLDTRDLVCTRGSLVSDHETNTETTVTFKVDGTVKEITTKNINVYNSEEQALSEFNSFKESIGADWEEYISLEKNIITIQDKDTVSHNMEGVLKKDIKKKYKENGYECK